MNDAEDVRYLRELKWLSPAAKTRAGDMVAEGERSARRHGIEPPEDELDAFLFAVGRSRGMALQVVDDVSRALDAAGDLAPRRGEGVQEADRGRTFAERIEVLARLAREGAAMERHKEGLLEAAMLLSGSAATLIECHSLLEKDAAGNFVPVAGSLEPGVIGDVRKHLHAIEALQALLEGIS